MKFFRISIMVLCVASVLWVVLPHDKLPSISLPKGAQHNTFGELPIVEVMDDGDFYEKDGDEEIARVKNMLNYRERYEFQFRRCLDKIDNQCGLIGSSKKVDKCRIKESDKCYKKLERQADKMGYYFWPTTGLIYFEATKDMCPESWLYCTSAYMGGYVWAPKPKVNK